MSFVLLLCSDRWKRLLFLFGLLSTTFFLLYINNILHTVPKSKVYTYADDTTLIITADNKKELQTLAQSELTNLITYFHKNNLVPNPTKTQYTIFYPTTEQETIQLHINKTPIQQTETAKLLGIFIEQKMKYHKTITNIIKKLQGTIRDFKYANKLLPPTTMLNIYHQQAYPHLIGDITIWGTSNPAQTYIQPLIRIQKKLIRLIKNLPPPNSHKTNHDRTETTKHDQPLHPKNMHHNAPFYTPHRPTEQTRT